MDPQWAENIKSICRRDNVSFFFKQMGGMGGDGAGGELLNGVKYQELPIPVEPIEEPSRYTGSPKNLSLEQFLEQ